MVVLTTPLSFIGLFRPDCSIDDMPEGHVKISMNLKPESLCSPTEVKIFSPMSNTEPEPWRLHFFKNTAMNNHTSTPGTIYFNQTPVWESIEINRTEKRIVILF